MASTINAQTTPFAAVVTTADDTGNLAFQTANVTAMTIDSSQQVTFSQAANLPNTFGFKNRLINGAMMIDQRNAGASVTPTDGQFLVDRWKAGLTQASKYTVQQNAGSVTPPTGFTNYLGITSSSSYSVLTSDTFLFEQVIEGFNVADLGWGTASAATITLSFWVRSSLTGTFGGAINNSASNRSYPFSYIISAANTWEQKSVTIAGDTSGTWLTTNGKGLQLRFGLGSGATFSGTAGAWTAGNLVQPTGSVSVVGTNGATFYITGVQLEKGSTATSFDYRPYGTELALCQRYYVGSKIYWFTVGFDPNYTTYNSGGVPWSYQMRATPSVVITSGGMAGHHTTAPSAISASLNGVELQFSGSALRTNVNCAANVGFTLSAEL